ncbi:hypothetical protein baBA2_000259 [Borrelia anserina]|uniref:Cytosolic protein n=2 Tax=Borrelia anserina TaxID=143 RepID=A0ABN4U9J7_BORAN|nr:hypothetical protein [Borrelia anserina]AHH08233.1 Putative cytosolic protein [Borrelia anserina BA2]APR64755.1 hypothetical protein N187_01290 [Borrelia anserina Es]UPA06670.1 hypothetical protein baBA2_000259 [Borrelia anserina]
MLFNKRSKYVLLFSSFAFVLSVVLGILARVPFITILFRAFFQFVFFFCIGLLLEFIYKKYLYDLFKDHTLSDDKEDDIDESNNCNSKSDNMNSFSENVSTNEDTKSDNYDSVEKLSKSKTVPKESKSNNEFNGKLPDQISYVERADPKVVAEAIKTLINKKE